MIHPLADVQSKEIGENTNIWQFCVILAGAKIGSGCNVCAQVMIESAVVVGNNVTIKNGVQLWDGVGIEDDVMIGPNVTFTNDVYPRSKNLKYILQETLVQKGASIGANSTIVAGITIGAYAMVGAGSVVVKNVAAHELVFGNPATHQGWVCRCGRRLESRLNSEFVCNACNQKYLF